MKYLYTSFCIIILGCLHAQVTFNNSYPIDNGLSINVESGWDVLVDEEGYTVISGLYCFNGTRSCIGLIKTDFEGNLLWEKLISEPLELTPSGTFIHTPDGGYIIAGDQYIGGSDFRWFLLRLDSNGNSLWIKFYEFDEIRDFVRNITQTPDNGFILHGDGGMLQGGKVDKAIIRTDSVGNVLWTKNLGLAGELAGEPLQNQFGNLVLLPDSSMMIAYRATYNTFVPDSAALIKLSPTGEVLWTKNYYQLSILCGPTLRLLPDGNYLMSGCKRENGFDLYATFQIIDPDGNVLKEKNRLALVAGGIYDIALASNGDILACGRNDSIKVANDLPYGSAAWVLRLDSDLNILWDRNYVSLKHHDAGSFNALKETPDGGIILTGGPIKDTLADGTIDHNIWLVKLDGDGCLHPECEDEGFIYLAVDEKEGIGMGRQVFFSVSPNPASRILKLRLFDSQSRKNAVLRLFNTASVLLRSEGVERGITEISWDISSYPAGFYFLTYEKNGMVVQQEKLVVQRE